MTDTEEPITNKGDSYAPGICNIGPAEVARRRRVGWAGVAGCLGVVAAVSIAGVGPLWMLGVWLPASLGASGFIQARLHFCAHFGWRGRYNFDELGTEQLVLASEARRQDRRRAIGIAAQSGAIGVFVASASVVAAAYFS